MSLRSLHVEGDSLVTYRMAWATVVVQHHRLWPSEVFRADVLEKVKLTRRGVQPTAAGCLWPRMAMNAAQHKIVNSLKSIFFFFLLIRFC